MHVLVPKISLRQHFQYQNLFLHQVSTMPKGCRNPKQFRETKWNKTKHQEAKRFVRSKKRHLNQNTEHFHSLKHRLTWIPSPHGMDLIHWLATKLAAYMFPIEQSSSNIVPQQGSLCDFGCGISLSLTARCKGTLYVVFTRDIANTFDGSRQIHPFTDVGNKKLSRHMKRENVVILHWYTIAFLYAFGFVLYWFTLELCFLFMTTRSEYRLFLAYWMRRKTWICCC